MHPQLEPRFVSTRDLAPDVEEPLPAELVGLRSTAPEPGRDRRRPKSDLVAGVPVAGFTGINGAGKTLLAVQSAICDLAAGRRVLSTVPIRSRWGDSEPLLSLRQLLELRDATVLLDEVAVIFSSRTTSSLPPEVVAFLQTLRHRGLTVRWTAPDWGRADILLRGVTQALVNVRPVLRVSDGTLWPRPILVAAGVLDTSTGKVDETPTRVLRRRFARPRRLEAWGAYDTHADTPMLGRFTEGGTCPDCGGSRERPKHSEARHAELGLPWYGNAR
jgi:Zonular occludens toxin (Zot)